MLRIILFVVLLMFLTACGGGDDPEPVPEVTLEPTLTFEERTAFVTGSIENPVRIVIRPIESIGNEIRDIIATVSERDSVQDELSLRDDLALADDLAALNAPLNETFGVQIDGLELALLLTVGDVVRYVQEAIGETVTQALFDTTSINFEIVTVSRHADALALVCESNLGIVSTAWLDGPTYYAARAQNCGDAELQVAMLTGGYNLPVLEQVDLPEVTPEATLEVTDEASLEATPTALPTATPEPTITPPPDAEATPEVTPEPINSTNRTGTAGVLVVSSVFGTNEVIVLQERTFCRLSYDDLFTWFVPSLILLENGIDPQTGLGTIESYDDLSTLIALTSEGRCAGMGISQDALDVASETFDDATLSGLRVSATSAPFPYGVFVYPPELRFDVRETINTAMIDLLDNDDAWEALRLLLGQDLIVEIEDGDLAVFDAYMQSTGLNFAQLGD